MKLNNKGTSLIELIVSIILMSIVLLFMLRLLTDVNNEQTNNSFAIDNQLVRTEILRVVENDLSTNVIQDITNGYSIKEDSPQINFIYENGTHSTLTYSSTTFSFEKFDENNQRVLIRSWDLKNCNLFIDKSNIFLSNDDKIYSLLISLEIHTSNELNNKDKNNILDDITISYIGNTDDLLDITKIQNLCIGKYC